MLTSVSPLEYSDPCIQSFTCCSKIMLSVSSFRFAVVLEMFECYLTKKLLSFFIACIYFSQWCAFPRKRGQRLWPFLERAKTVKKS